ncbi:hypothetical protein ThidrDRAFT_0141 [Thiorhodococcus drewsii AZ1]|uniref:Uncharacterized protein n=1 Tax=Thiorhodococcus drewsii AZ1 TaxID=765913 RepID=G2DVH1_9GAMM|nr:hypothetical protein [Thiorhodococcus drewsii]EGV33986.1 hypothetical protein ThidrDRAFT_0141 [Thiorhodococcus drewsii AZ1]
MFAKSTLASAVAAAIGVSAVGIAQADSVLFPQVVLSDTVTTIASVINTSGNNWTNDGARNGSNLHYRFFYKGASNTDPCQEYNEYLPTSQNDIQTIDLSGYFGSDTKGVLFSDPSTNNDWSTATDYAFGRYVSPARGYLYVDNADDANGAVGDATLSGEAFVFEFGSGAAWGYQAYSNDTTTANMTSADIGNSADYRFAASASPSQVALMPFDEIETAFFVTPVSSNMASDVSNPYAARVEFYTSMNRGDLFDRDENLISGAVPQDVVCVARVNAKSLMSDGTMNRVTHGGWARLLNYRLDKVGGNPAYSVPSSSVDANGWAPAYADAGSTADASSVEFSEALVTKATSGGAGISKTTAPAGAIVIKLEYNVGGTFNGETVGGVYNNAVLLQP